MVRFQIVKRRYETEDEYWYCKALFIFLNLCKKLCFSWPSYSCLLSCINVMNDFESVPVFIRWPFSDAVTPLHRYFDKDKSYMLSYEDAAEGLVTKFDSELNWTNVFITRKKLSENSVLWHFQWSLLEI